jgi:DNA-binding MarR family transcriptional regulator
MTRYHRTACVLDRELQARHDLSVSEFEILQQLFNAGDGCGSVRMQELASEVHLSQSALSRLISRLERDGLVGRASCPQDRRSVFVNITDAGRDRFLTARPTQRAVLREQAATPV